MRHKIHYQKSIVESYFNHNHSEELKVIDEIISRNKKIINFVHSDLTEDNKYPNKGRKAKLSARQVLKILLVKQMNGFSYEELRFHLLDSRCYRSFCEISFTEKRCFSKSTLQRNITKIKPQTLEKINREILGYAKELKIETGKKTRVDCTVVETNIHKPTDSSLLYDCIKTICRYGQILKEKYNFKIRNRHRVGKKVAKKIIYHRGKKRKKLYNKLCKTTMNAVKDVFMVLEDLQYNIEDAKFIKELVVYCFIALQVINQTKRRVFQGEKVPAKEKIFSIFELHTDIIIKKRREVEYGHKITLSNGKSGMILDLNIEKGNPADSTLATKMAERLNEIYGKYPHDIAFDGGFTSKNNLKELKKLGIKNVCFHKKCNLKVEDMVKSTWVYNKLKNFRAGIEGIISFLKRCFGLTRCTWKGIEHFHSYVWSSVVTANTLILARRIIARRKKE